MTGFTTTTYKEERRPSEDAATVGRWIIAPSILAAFLGFFIFFGIAGAAGLPLWHVFALGVGGGGFVGFLVMSGTLATYDRKPYVSIRETTQEPVRETPKKQEPIRGNAAPTYTQPNGAVDVQHGDKKYQFSRKQIKSMLDRLDDENYQVARKPFGITPEDYHTVADIMVGLGYWQVWKQSGKINRVELLNDGADWLREVSR